MRDRNGAVVCPYLITIGMISMVMRVERETNGFVGERANLGNNFLCAGGEIAVDDEHVILEDDPPVVAMTFALEIALVEINVRCDLLHLVNLGLHHVRKD